MYVTGRKLTLEEKRRMYRANWVRSLGEAGVIFRQLYGCNPLRYLDMKIAEGMKGMEADADMHRKLFRIQQELRECNTREAKKEYEMRHNDGFYTATDSDDVPFP